MMVSSTVHVNGDVIPTRKVSSNGLGVPPGNYRLVGWDMDATGKQLIDEICQIAAHTRGFEFSQYVMPFKDLTPTAIKRHHLKVVTMGRYRVLKNCFTNKVLKTKSEVSALTDFVQWLENVRGNATDGVILVHHEPRRVNAPILIEALTKYNLLEKFKRTVKGFANGFDIAKAKCASTLKAFSMRTLSRVFLDKEEELSDASKRARLALQIVQHLGVSEENCKVEEEIGSGDSEEKTTKAAVELIREFAQPVEAEERECAELKLVLARQNSLKPIFRPLINSMVRRERQQASPLRRLLAESAIDYVQLQEAWASGKEEALENLIKEKVRAEKKDIDDLIAVLDCHFDPEKKLPHLSDEEKKSPNKDKLEQKTLDNNNHSETESPDTTSYSPIKSKMDEDAVTTNMETLGISD